MINYFRLFCLNFKDFLLDKKIDISGLWIFTGLYGSGKTLSMTKEGYDLYKQGYKVYSNYFTTFSEKVTMEYILNINFTCVILIDEISNIFNSHNWHSLPDDFFALLSQCRKYGIRLMSTAQDFEHVSKQVRDLTKYIIDCNKHNRLVNNHVFSHTDSFENEIVNIKYIAEDFYFGLYNTHEFVINDLEAKSAKTDRKKKVER